MFPMNKLTSRVGHSTFHLMHLVLRNNWFRQPALQVPHHNLPTGAPANFLGVYGFLKLQGGWGIDTAPHPTITGDQKEKWQLKTSIVEQNKCLGGGGRGMKPECLIHHTYPQEDIFAV